MDETVQPVKLFVVTLHRDQSILANAIAKLSGEFGPVDYESTDFPFDITDYYESEMGKNLFRRFYSFQELILPDRIVNIKLKCMEIEREFAVDSRRAVNLDPGYMDTYKLVLASAKYGGQKIYLRDGIYADMTLTMYRRKWESFLWGFPDFKSGIYEAVLNQIRDTYKKQLRSLRLFDKRGNDENQKGDRSNP